jgi:guanine nucleotide-binding protein alpha-1 subunit
MKYNFNGYSQPFHTERASWRTVIQLNVVQSIRLIIDTMSDISERRQSSVPAPDSRHPSNLRLQRNSDLAAVSEPGSDFPVLSPELLRLKLQLSPLIQIEQALVQKLSPSGSGPPDPMLLDKDSISRRKEVALNFATWRRTFDKSATSPRGSFDSQNPIDFDDPKDSAVVLQACAGDMKKLWNDPTVKSLLAMRKLRLEEVAGL